MTRWHTPRTWVAGSGRAVLPWHLRTDLRDNPRLLRKRQEASCSIYWPAGHDQPVRATSEVTVAWQTPFWDYGSLTGTTASSGTDTRISSLTVPEAGLYEGWFVIEWNDDAGLASGIRQVQLVLNGADSDQFRWVVEPGNADSTAPGRTDQWGYWQAFYNVGDRLELKVQHTSSQSEFTINSGLEHSRMGLNFIGQTTSGTVAAWTAPRTWAAGDQPTATSFNTDIRDNLLNLRYCRGVAGIANPTANQTFASATATAVTFGEALTNMGTVWAVGTPTRLTAPVTGWYTVWAIMQWDGNNEGTRRHDVRVNGTRSYRCHSLGRVSDDNRGLGISLYLEIPLTANDYVEFFLTQRHVSGVNLMMQPTRGGLLLLGD